MCAHIYIYIYLFLLGPIKLAWWRFPADTPLQQTHAQTRHTRSSPDRCWFDIQIMQYRAKTQYVQIPSHIQDITFIIIRTFREIHHPQKRYARRKQQQRQQMGATICAQQAVWDAEAILHWQTRSLPTMIQVVNKTRSQAACSSNTQKPHLSQT